MRSVKVVLAAAIGAACARSPGAPVQAGAERPVETAARGEVTIVSSMPAGNPGADAILDGVRLALEERHFRAGAYTVKWRALSDAGSDGNWDGERVAEIAEAAVADPGVVAYLGPFNSGAAQISMPILNQAGLVMVSPMCTYPTLTRALIGQEIQPDRFRPSGQINFFRTIGADDDVAVAAAEWIARHDAAAAVQIVREDSMYGAPLAPAFEARASKLGLRVSNDPAPVVFVAGWGTPETILRVEQIARTTSARIVLPSAWMDPQMLKALVAAAPLDGRLFVIDDFPDPMLLGAAGVRFVDAFGSDRATLAVRGYVAAQVILDAIEKAGADRAAVLRAVAATRRDASDLLGSWSFDENGDISPVSFGVHALIDGEWRATELISLAVRN